MSDDSSPIIAVIDEAAPADRGGIYYVVTAALLVDATRVRTRLAGLEVPQKRTRPFHWSREGPRARNWMVEIITTTGVVAHVVVHYPTGRHRQEEARRLAMAELLPLVISDGADELIIESRSAHEDQRDRTSVIEALRRADGTVPYRWENKAEPLLWVADALCGAVKEYLLHEDGSPYEQLQTAKVIDKVRYRRLP